MDVAEKKFRKTMDEVRVALKQLVPSQVENVDEEIDMIIAQAVKLKAEGNKNDLPETYMHICWVLAGDRWFWPILEKIRIALVADFLGYDVPRKSEDLRALVP